ncbi:MAG: OsmC family protein [Nitrospinota bacterium]|nr:OsmC family protein [Nitrospinota bacterium]
MSQESVKDALMKTIGAIQAKPGVASLVFRSETALVEDLRCEAKIRQFPTITVDEPTELGGGNSAPNPLELVMAALGTCQEIMYGAYASVMGVKLTSVKVDVKGYIDLRGALGMDESLPSGYTHVEYVTTIQSPAPEEALAKLVMTVESHCPVLDSLQRPVQVFGQVHVNGNRLEVATV